MTLFEYLAIAFSLVFSFTVLRLVGGLPHATRPGRIYWVHLTFLSAGLLNIVGWFWAFWSYRDVTWTYPKFLLALGSPSALYFLAALLVPNDPASVSSWRDYYFSMRRRLFIGLACWGVVSALTPTIVLGMPVLHPARSGQVVTVVLAIVGLSSENPRVHAGLAVFTLLAVVAFGITVLVQPGGLS